MSSPQGLIFYGQQEPAISGTFTLSAGMQPSKASIYVAPHPGFQVPGVSTLKLTYGGVNISFPKCRVTHLTSDVGREGEQVIGIHVVDFRWQWKYFTISGEYNVRLLNKEIRSNTKKSAQELAKLLFKTMNVPNADVGAVPTNSFPEVKWEYTRCDQAMGDLLDPFGCRVVIGPNNTVRVVKLGQGQNLVKDLLAMDDSLALEGLDRPDKLKFVGGRSKYQEDIPITVAVGKDLDGKLKPIDNLSFKPTGGWENSDPPFFESITNTKAKQLAVECVFKWYMPKIPFTMGTTGGKILKYADMVPLLSEQVQRAETDESDEPLPAQVYGIFHPGDEANDDTITALDADLNTKPQQIYRGSFEIVAERCLVKFSDPIFRLKKSPTTYGSIIVPADLRLRTSIYFRDKDTRAFKHYEREKTMPWQQVGGIVESVYRDDLSLNVYKTSSGQLVTNEQELQAAADLILQGKQREYDIGVPHTITFAGFRPVFPDGAISQITWSASGEATTRVSRNREEDIREPTYEQKRWLEKVNTVLKAVDKPAPVVKAL